MNISKTKTKLNRLNARKWLTTENTDRLYVFVDEAGDTGLPSHPSASEYFMISVLVSDTNGLSRIEKHFSRYRYFRNADKELKRYRSGAESQDLLNDLLLHVSNTKGVMSFSFCLDKKSYIGPYLNSIKKSEEDYDATRFRNFILRIALEKVFEFVPVVKSVDNEFRSIEIILDRYLESREDEENLKKYLNENYNLPTIQFINQADSLYCTPLQVVDVLGYIIKSKMHDGLDIKTENIIKIFKIDNPDKMIEIKEKDPDTHKGTGSFPSIST